MPSSQPSILDFYYGRPDARCLAARDELFAAIARRSSWAAEFEKGRMVGVLIAADAAGREVTLRAHSGIMALDAEARTYFVPPVYDLDRPDGFYRTEERAITELNRQIADPALPEERRAAFKMERARRSLALQREIFRRFVFMNAAGEQRDLIAIFDAARHTLPPGGAGECAAPRLLHHALVLGLRPVALAEFWYGRSPAGESRTHGCRYAPCVEKCAPILAWMLPQAPTPSPTAPRGDDVPTILYEDDDVVVVHKPAGMLSVPGKAPQAPDVETWLLLRYPTCRPPMLVHRLDMATSGLLVAAQTAESHKRLQSQFMSRAVGKRYVAWTEGDLPSSRGVLSLPLCPNPEDRPRQVVDFHFGKAALTRYEVLRRQHAADGRAVTLVAFYPLTGRTHQLRVHAADERGLGSPIVGDTLYHPAPAAASRLMLHAEEVRFYHPRTNGALRVSAPSGLPDL